MILIAAESDAAGSRGLSSLLRRRLRPTDTLCRLDGRGFLVVASDTNPETADVLAADMRRDLDRANGGSEGATIKVHAANGDTTAAALLEQVIESSDGKEEWGTVGVDDNIIEASLQALVDSMEFALLRK